MNFLPVCSRELRIAARKRSTVWVRVVAAAIALVLGFGLWSLAAVFSGGRSQAGTVVFGVLSWMCMVSCLSAGLFLTSDCLSEEKREGTLGLLFLTDLRGYDVVSGKLLATSLRAFYGLLAVLPILGITLLMGGVSGAEYWRSSLALVNALVFSLSAGLLVSTLAVSPQKAFGGTFAVLTLATILGHCLDGLSGLLPLRSLAAVLNWASPAYVLVAAGAGRSEYWSSLAVTQSLAWLMFILACGLAPKTWQVNPHAGRVRRGWFFGRGKSGAAGSAPLRLRHLLERSPVSWLVCREFWRSRLAWALALVLAAQYILTLVVFGSSYTGALELWSRICTFLGWILYVGTASFSVRFFSQMRSSGMLELLVETPLSNREVLAGQGRVWGRVFGPPAVVLLSIGLVGGLLTAWKRAGGPFAGMPGGPEPFWILTMEVIGAGAGVATIAANLAALHWFGLWVGLNTRKANLGILKTLLFVQILPPMAIYFCVGILSIPSRYLINSSGGGVLVVYMLFSLVIPVLIVAKDVVFILWARKRLLSSWRIRAAQDLERSGKRPMLAGLSTPVRAS
jgi:hypothetical protein